MFPREFSLNKCQDCCEYYQDCQVKMESAALNQKEYLKKYLGIGKQSGEKKKKRTKDKKTDSKFKIIDDDIDINISQEIQEDIAANNEDAPQIVAVIDERPPSLRVDEETKSKLWKPIGDPSDVNVATALKIGSFQLKSSKENSLILGIKNKLKTDKLKKDYKLVKDHSNVDKVTNDYPSSRKLSPSITDRGYSPPRQQKSELERDYSPPRKHKEYENYYSPHRKRKSESEKDYSPPRKRKSESEKDYSPPRKRKSESEKDYSPPRKRKSETEKDYSPPRKKKSDSEKDYSPLRKQQSKLEKSYSPLRKVKSEAEKDYSPPRKRNSEPEHAYSPARRQKLDSEKDYSPNRRHKSKQDEECTQSKQNSPKRTDYFQSKQNQLKSDKEHSSPKRKPSRWGISPESQRSLSRSPERVQKTLSGKKAGLQNAKELTKEIIALREKEEAIFKNMSDDMSGRNAAPVIRSQKPKNLEEEALQLKQQQERQEKYDRWGKGLKQVQDENEKLKEQLSEMNKPLARYADDEDLERYLKEQEREGDPMLNYIRKKKRKKAIEAGVSEKPMYMGEFMPNRYGIRPGYRWDGVDRSNGYEKNWFQVYNAKKATQEEAFKWSTEDM